MPYTYILECADGSYYVGSTWKDTEARVGEHNDGEGSRYTRRRLPVTLLWAEYFDRMEDAFRLEKQIQGWSRAKRRALIEGRFGDLPALSWNSQRKAREGEARDAPPDRDDR
jgi:putative endonuclease